MRMRQSVLAFALAAAFALVAGCSASGASSGNFELVPERVGWYVGETAQFTLNITPSLTRQAPGYTIDRNFAIEELRFEERGASFGGDYKTRNPDDVSLVLLREGHPAQEVELDQDNPTILIQVEIPAKLRDSEYTFAIELFKVGWVKSDPFRVDEKPAT